VVGAGVGRKRLMLETLPAVWERWYNLYMVPMEEPMWCGPGLSLQTQTALLGSDPHVRSALIRVLFSVAPSWKKRYG
jgi:hypothetical protein